ncbi:hypothetical protein Tco_1275806 [Tanacetum coccineum]
MHNNIWRLVKSSFPHNAMEQEDILSGVHVFYDTLTLKEMIPQHDEAETETTCLQRTNCIFKLKRKLFSDFKLGENTLNVQMLKTNLFLGIGKFTSRDGESWSRITPIMTIKHQNIPQCSSAQASKQIIFHKDQVHLQTQGKEISNSYTYLSQYLKERTVIRTSSRDKDTAKEFGTPCNGFGHYAEECRKPKWVKDYTYHKKKMMMCKQAEQGVPLQAEQADWLENTDEEIDELELEAHYSFMAKIQEVIPEESSSTDQPLEQKDDSNVTPDSSNICNNDNQVDQNAAECVDERVVLPNLIAN